MHIAKEQRFDIWHAAKCYLDDSLDYIEPNTVKLLMGAIRARSVKTLLNVTIPMHSGVHAYRVIAQIQALFKNNASFSDEELCRSNAEKRFLEAESLCRATNKRMAFYEQYPGRDKFAYQIDMMKIYMQVALGDVRACLDSMPKHLRYTSGASENTKRSSSYPAFKIKRVNTVTAGAVPLFVAAAKYFGCAESFDGVGIATFGSARIGLRIVDSNRIVLVPKNYKTYRTIAAEPQANLPFQLAIDAYLKSRLMCLGTDLRSQQRNKDLAKLSSINGTYATIDLSMASDTLSYGLIKRIVPQKWFALLSALRAPCYKGPFGTGVYAKFSSMGNGYTFPLETLVFKAACFAVGALDHTVYGDDIIVPTHDVKSLIRLLRHIGFLTNEDKTFVDGPFRESCGADYYNGVDVRPFFIKKSANLGKMELSHVINGLVRIGRPSGHLWHYCRDLVRRNRLLIVPATEATRTGVHCDYDANNGFGRVRYSAWIPRFRAYMEIPVGLDHPHFLVDQGVKAYVLKTLQMQVIGECIDTRGVSLREYALLCREIESASTGPVIDRKVITDWMNFIPLKVLPPHLHAWSAYLRS